MLSVMLSSTVNAPGVPLDYNAMGFAEVAPETPSTKPPSRARCSMGASLTGGDRPPPPGEPGSEGQQGLGISICDLVEVGVVEFQAVEPFCGLAHVFEGVVR